MPYLWHTYRENLRAAAGRGIDLAATLVPLIAKGNIIIASLLPRRVFKLKEVSTDEVGDFIRRHGSAIERATRPLKFKHTCRYPPGKVEWLLQWRFPFVRRHVYKTMCCCDILFIMDEITHALKDDQRIVWGLVDVYND